MVMRRFSAFFGLIALFLLACGLPGLSRSPQPPTPEVETVTVSEEAAQQFEEKVGQLGQDKPRKWRCFFSTHQGGDPPLHSAIQPLG
ncbi:MAG: hypothetical protein Q9O62_15590, partial [Ardenticatenia bacterium]|nr:hypothetical protein [Ardenticatenia bacterium]